MHWGDEIKMSLVSSFSLASVQTYKQCLQQNCTSFKSFTNASGYSA